MSEDEQTRIAARDAVIRQIETAFDGVGRKFGVSLHEACVIDDYGSRWEQMQARMTDTEWRWQDVPEADIARYFWILSFLDPIGFRYYLPAYMVWTLKNHEQTGSMSDESTVFALFISDGSRAYSMERFTMFTRQQAEAICAFLRFIAKNTLHCGYNDTAQEALEQYWGRFCTPMP